MTDQSPGRRVRSALRVARPQAGAVANASDAVFDDRRSARERRESALSVARTAGPASWTPVERPVSPVRSGAGHAVIVYLDDADLVARLASYVADGLSAGEICVVVATAGHRAGLRQRLIITGLGDALASGLLVELDAHELLDAFLVDGWPDSELFDVAVTQVLRNRMCAGVGLRAFGEMVGLLTAQDNLPAALHLEKLWDALQLQLRFPLLCAYPVSAVAQQGDDALSRVHARHSHLAVVPG